MSHFFNIERNDLVVIAAIAGGLIVALRAQRAWRELTVVLFSGISVAVFLGPFVCALLDIKAETVLVAVSFVLGLGGNALAIKIVCWWEHLTITEIMAYFLRREKEEKSKKE